MAEKEGGVVLRAPLEFGVPGRLKGGVAKWLALALVGTGITLCVLFTWTIVPFGYFIDINVYAYFTLACFVPCVLLNTPLSKRSPMNRIPWYDWLAAFSACVISIYFSFYAIDMFEQGWAVNPSTPNLVLAFVLFLLTLEGARRTGGSVFLIVTLACCVYPLFSEYLPGAFKGVGFTFAPLIGNHIFGSEGILGIPMIVVGEILFGFIILAGLLLTTGAGEFFLNLAMSVAGHTRGGRQK